MGKGEEEPLPSTIAHSQSTPRNADNCSCCCRIAHLFRFRCVFILILGLSVLLSAVFWLPPFFRHGDKGDLDLDSHYKGHDIVATFMVEKPLSLLEDDFPQLGGDIFDEIRVPTTKVVIITAESSGSNTTKIIFGVDPDEHNSKIPSYAKSVVRDSFVSIVLGQSPLRLTESLFGQPSSFEVLKFVGGITVTPDQSAYPLQKVQIRFNFTLNFSIEQILDHFDELTIQLRSGLHLAQYENLHVSLTNPQGSTVAPYTTVQSSVVLAIGTPSMARSKQLAQTIKGSPTQNLGLNNTQFGKVKQISLSSISLNASSSSSSGAAGVPVPSPSPLPNPPPQPHRHHHHHHHHHHDKPLPPAKPPSPAAALPVPPTPAPTPSPHPKSPACRPGYHKKKHPPVSQPAPPPHIPPPPPPPRSPPPPPPLPPPPPPPVTETIPASSPLPNVVFARSHPPTDTYPSDAPSPGPFSQPSSACAGVDLRAITTFLVTVTLHVLLQK